MRMVLLVGGSVIFFSGTLALWRVRKLLAELGHIERRTALEAVTGAFRDYRRSAAGEQVNNDDETVETADDRVEAADGTGAEIGEEEDIEE